MGELALGLVVLGQALLNAYLIRLLLIKGSIVKPKKLAEVKKPMFTHGGKA